MTAIYCNRAASGNGADHVRSQFAEMHQKWTHNQLNSQKPLASGLEKGPAVFFKLKRPLKNDLEGRA